MKFSLNQDELTVTIKDAVVINKDNDDFNLRWFDNKPSSQGRFHLDLTNRVTPPDILSQLKNNGIVLTQKWVILDEFICF
jgi:hypothetical protein